MLQMSVLITAYFAKMDKLSIKLLMFLSIFYIFIIIKSHKYNQIAQNILANKG